MSDQFPGLSTPFLEMRPPHRPETGTVWGLERVHEGRERRMDLGTRARCSGRRREEGDVAEGEDLGEVVALHGGHEAAEDEFKVLD